MDCVSPDYSADENSLERMKDDELIAYLNEEGQVLDFDIQQIMYRFAQAYGEIFCISKKCHFDSLPDDWNDDERVVDGARSKWCPPLLLDGLISFLDNDAFNLSHRRTFNQHKILHECIHEVLQESHEDIHDMLLARKSSYRKSPGGAPSPGPQQWFPFLSSINCVDTDVPFLSVHGLEAPWTDLGQLKESLLSGPASKSRDKLVSIVSWLCVHPSLRALDMDLHKVFKVVVFKSLFIYPPPASRVSHSAQLGARARKRMRGMPTLQLLMPSASQRSPTPALSATGSPSPSPRSPLSPSLYSSLRSSLDTSSPSSPPSQLLPRQHGYCLRESAARAQREAIAMGLFRPIRSHTDLLGLRPRHDTVHMSPASSDSEMPVLPVKKRGRPPRGMRTPILEAKTSADATAVCPLPGLTSEEYRRSPGSAESPQSKAGQKRKATGHSDDGREGLEAQRMTVIHQEENEAEKEEEMFAALCEQFHPHPVPHISPVSVRPGSGTASPAKPAASPHHFAPHTPPTYHNPTPPTYHNPTPPTYHNPTPPTYHNPTPPTYHNPTPPPQAPPLLLEEPTPTSTSAAPHAMDWELIPTAAWELSDETWSLAADRTLVRPVPTSMPTTAFSSELWEWMDKHCGAGNEPVVAMGLTASAGIPL